MGKGSVTALSLLGSSAVFDTIDHTILLDRVHAFYGISTLGSFISYLWERTHSVMVGSTLSHVADHLFWAPRVLLGPILFSLYTNPISSIIHSNSSMKYHYYVNNNQLNITLSPANFSHS